MAEYTAYFNGEWVPKSELKIDPGDRGFTMGDVVFDVERTFDGKLFKLKEHMDRLYRSLGYFRIDPGLSVDEMTEVTEELVRRNEDPRAAVGDYTVRQIVTRGVPFDASQAGMTDNLQATVMNFVAPLHFRVYAQYYETGASVVFPSARSYSSSSLDPKAKHYSRGNFVHAQIQAADMDPAAYPVLLDQDGNISENVGGNFFLVTDGAIRTPRDSSILQGISRQTVLELGAQLGIPVIEEDLQPYDAYTADEAFLSTSSYQVLPVATIDKRHVRHDVPGPITQQLLAAWGEMVGVDIVGQALEFANR
jgi:branched-chain amino acid aminotransferase